MSVLEKHIGSACIPEFNRKFFTGNELFSRIGTGEIGGKAHGLIAIKQDLEQLYNSDSIQNIVVDIPLFSVITTYFFDLFMKQNNLYKISLSDFTDERIAHHFQSANLPADLIGDLWALISKVHTPLAIRSSSLLEDSLETPFAGIYATKMISNNQPDTESRFRKLVEAIKYVYSSTFFKNAKDYAAATYNDIKAEKMAVIIQEVVGLRHRNRFYPNISGVARSYNYYPFGRSKPEYGVVNLALGLGKTIVDGGLCWSYSPAHPQIDPPHNSIQDLLKQSQTDFWAVNMGGVTQYDPVNEAEYLVKLNLSDAEYDNVLAKIVSTYDANSDRVYIGTGRKGPRIVTFAPILHFEEPPLNQIIKEILPMCENSVGGKVEIEFAVTIDNRNSNTFRFSLLQVRRMASSEEKVYINMDDIDNSDILLKSNIVLGNGKRNDIQDIVYIKPDTFDYSKTKIIASQLEVINKQLSKKSQPYMLIGFGRWGSTDPWLGIPVNWGQISQAKVIVESFHPKRSIDFSQGSHFFHNVSNLHIMYFYIKDNDDCHIDWKWLDEQKIVNETDFIKHIHLINPVKVVVSLKNKLGVVIK